MWTHRSLLLQLWIHEDLKPSGVCMLWQQRAEQVAEPLPRICKSYAECCIAMSVLLAEIRPA